MVLASFREQFIKKVNQDSTVTLWGLLGPIRSINTRWTALQRLDNLDLRQADKVSYPRA